MFATGIYLYVCSKTLSENHALYGVSTYTATLKLAETRSAVWNFETKSDG